MRCTGHNIAEYRRLLRRRRQWQRTEEIKGELRKMQGALGYEDARRITGRKVQKGGGRSEKDETEYSLFRQYMARLDQLPGNMREGHVEYKPVPRADFDKWSRKRQLLELKKLGMDTESADDIKNFFVKRDDDMYPTTHTTLEMPKIAIKQSTTADILHHQYHMKRKIQRLYGILRELRKEGRKALRRRIREVGETQSGQLLSQGVSRTRQIYDTNRSIKAHCNLYQDLETEIKVRVKKHRINPIVKYINEQEPLQKGGELPTNATRHVKKKQGCRHHVRKGTNKEATHVQTTETVTEDQRMERQELDRGKTDTTTTKIYYQGEGRVGGKGKRNSQVEPNIRVGTLNVNGLNENKLELILQFFAEENLDVLMLVDTRLEQKTGKYMGKKIKRRLGPGTRTHITPCILDYETDATTGFRKVGGLISIISPKWGTSIREFQDDKFGPNGASAGVMTQATLSTINGDINIIGAYWPNKHGSNDTSDQNLWRCLQRYILKHRMIDRSPTDLLQRVAGVWTQTAIKNGARATILCGDLNATWTGAEGGGQAILTHWADGMSFSNGIRTIAQQRNEYMYTRGEEGQPTTWIDHVLHKGNADNIQIVDGYTSQAAIWEGITDHRPIWGGYVVNMPAQPTPRKPEMTKVRWELRLTDRAKCDEYTEAMEDFENEIEPPQADTSIDDIFKYMEKLHSHMFSTVKKLYHKAGQDKRFSSHKDGWSPTFIAYKAHLTALVMIRRHVTGQKRQRKWKDLNEMKEDLGAIITDWDNKMISLDIAAEQLAVIQSCTSRNRDWWSTTTVIPLLEDIDSDINRIKLLLHGANRREFRRRMNSHIRAREDKRREGKWGHVLNSVLGTLRGRKGQEAVDLDVVQTRDGNIVGDPHEIHNLTTKEFDEVFYGKPVWCKGALHEGQEWERCLRSETYFLNDTEYSNVPMEYRQLLYKAITSVSQRETVEEISRFCRLLRRWQSLKRASEGLKPILRLE